MDDKDGFQQFRASISSNVILGTFLVCLWARLGFELYLRLKQRKIYTSATPIPTILTNIPNINSDTYDKIRLFTNDLNDGAIVGRCWTAIVVTLLLAFDGLYYGWSLIVPLSSNEVVQSIIFIIFAVLFQNVVVVLPINIYSNVVLRKKHRRMHREEMKTILLDLCRHPLAQLIIFLGIGVPIVWIFQGSGDLDLTYLVIVTVFVGIIMFYKTFIHPSLFGKKHKKLKGLKEGSLREKIEALAERLHFPLAEIEVISVKAKEGDSMKIVQHLPRVYLYGCCRKNRIILYNESLIKDNVSRKDKDDSGGSMKENNKDEENLMEKKRARLGLVDDEFFEVLVAQQLGHWKLNHHSKQVAIKWVDEFVKLGILTLILKNKNLYDGLGFPENTRIEELPCIHSFLFFALILAQIYTPISGFLKNLLTHRFTFQTDHFLHQLGYGDQLALVLRKQKNVEFLKSDPWFVAWNFPYPTLLQRLEAIDNGQMPNSCFC